MSLRRDIHVAFETITPPLGGMPERVVETVVAEQKATRRKERMLSRFRAPLSLVAVFVVIAIVAAVLVGGRLIQDWNAAHKPAPAGGGPVTTATLADLEARPVNLPAIKACDPCPQSPSQSVKSYYYGAGPVYADGGQKIDTGWGSYFDVTYYTDAKLKGLVLLRGRDLRDPSHRLTFVGKYVAGAVVGNDPAQGTGPQYEELVLDASHPPARLYNQDGYWAVRQGMSRGWSNCFGFQVDGTNFTERVTAGT